MLTEFRRRSYPGEELDLEDGLGNVEGKLLDLEGNVGKTCTQLEAVTTQSDEILSSLLGSSVKSSAACPTFRTRPIRGDVRMRMRPR